MVASIPASTSALKVEERLKVTDMENFLSESVAGDFVALLLVSVGDEAGIRLKVSVGAGCIAAMRAA